MKHIKLTDVTKVVPFMKQEVEVKSLSVEAVENLQKDLEALGTGTDLVHSMKSMQIIFKHTVIGADKLTAEDFKKFPINELKTLSEAVMAFNGLNATDDKGNSLGK